MIINYIDDVARTPLGSVQCEEVPRGHDLVFLPGEIGRRNVANIEWVVQTGSDGQWIQSARVLLGSPW